MWLLYRFADVPLWAPMTAGGLLSLPLIVDGIGVNPPS